MNLIRSAFFVCIPTLTTHRHHPSENVRGGNSAVRRIVFVWAVRDGGIFLFRSSLLTNPNIRSTKLRSLDMDLKGTYRGTIIDTIIHNH